MIFSEDIEFEFKGDRNYIHGTDIYEKTVKILVNQGFTSISRFKLAFHKISTQNLNFILSTKQDGFDKESTCATIQLKSKNESYFGNLIEIDSLVKGRYEYNESVITNKSTVIGSALVIPNLADLRFKLIEIIVAGNKFLLSNIFKEITGKWLFSKIELNHYLSEDKVGEVSIELVKNIGVKMTKSRIQLDGKDKGYIYFSMI